MLLYVNKKQERLKKLKLITIIFTIFFIIFANIHYLITHFHDTSSILTSYTPIKKTTDWYSASSPITIYKNASSQIRAIIIPKLLTPINSSTIAYCFQRTKNPLFFASDVPDVDFLQKIAQTLNLKTTPTNISNSVIVTSTPNNILPIIYQEKLVPQTLSHRQLTNNHLSTLLENKFPSAPTPKTKLEKEQFALQLFADTHFNELQNLISGNTFIKQPFAKQDALLKNVSLCLQTSKETICDTSPQISLAKKISNLTSTLPSPSPIQKLILLTSEEKITPDTFNPENGLLFRFEQRETLLLPKEITSTPFKTIKQKLGINPNYTNKLMQFYQFKTVEIPLQ